MFLAAGFRGGGGGGFVPSRSETYGAILDRRNERRPGYDGLLGHSPMHLDAMGYELPRRPAGKWGYR